MRFVRLGTSGLRISQLVLGTATFGELVDGAGVERIVHAALDRGISTFDTGDAYAFGESEKLLGHALKRDRQRAVICTKVGLRVGDSELAHASAFRGGYDHAARWRQGISPNDAGLSRAHIIPAVDASLRRLGTDWIDLYQVHRWDHDVPIEETLDALDDLVRAGKVRYIGCSQYAADQLCAAAAASRDAGLARFVSMQLPFNLLHRDADADVLPAAEETGTGVLAFQTLAGGMLTGRYSRESGPEEGSRMATRATYRDRYWKDATFDLVDRLGALADRFGRRPEELAMGWVLSRRAVSAVITGAERQEDVERNVALMERPLGEEELAAVNALAG
ncbi:MAG: aldo/keto reductase [Novosphingobium sp.]|nr:aldo/keto reductase [Novosphingobium sp.]